MPRRVSLPEDGKFVPTHTCARRSRKTAVIIQFQVVMLQRQKRRSRVVGSDTGNALYTGVFLAGLFCICTLSLYGVVVVQCRTPGECSRQRAVICMTSSILRSDTAGRFALPLCLSFTITRARAGPRCSGSWRYYRNFIKLFWRSGLLAACYWLWILLIFVLPVPFLFRMRMFKSCVATTGRRQVFRISDIGLRR